MNIENFMDNFYISDKGILFENKNLKNEEYKKIDSLLKNKELKINNNYVSYQVEDIISLGLGIDRNVNQNEKIFDINIKYNTFNKNIKMSSLPEMEILTKNKISKLALNYNKVFHIYQIVNITSKITVPIIDKKPIRIIPNIGVSEVNKV
jgi:hypothetical protein